MDRVANEYAKIMSSARAMASPARTAVDRLKWYFTTTRVGSLKRQSRATNAYLNRVRVRV